MKKVLIAVLAALPFLFACQSGKNVPSPAEPTGYIVLNNGSWGANNATVSLYNPSAKTVSGSAFFAANNLSLGDLGQDIMRYGDDLYIAVNGSKLIFMTDKDLKVKKTIVAKAEDESLSPRALCSGGGKVYVTYYEGYLGEIDPSTYAVRTVEVGPNPEGVVYHDGKIFTADSGGYVPGYHDKVSVVDAATFTRVSSYTVNVNPQMMDVCGGKIYVSSFGNYYDIAPKVQCIDVAAGTVTDLDCASPSAIALSGSDLYVLCGGYDADYQLTDGTVVKFDALTGSKVGEFVTDGTVLEHAYSISATSRYVWVGSSTFTTNGSVYMLGASDGKLVHKFGSEGINPLKVIE